MAASAKSGWVGNIHFLIVPDGTGYQASVTTPKDIYKTKCFQMKQATKWVDNTINKFKEIKDESDRDY